MRAPTYAEATSTLALFVALGGVSWAATTLPKNSVNSAAIRDAQVRGADLAPGSVGASKLSKDLRAQLGVTSGKDGASGDTGASGADGKPGPAGTAGPAGRDGAAIVTRANFGSHSVTGTTFTKVGELTWTQPAHALDDIRGLYTSHMVGCANTGGGAAYRLVVDGVEVSQDYGNLAPDQETNYDPDPVLVSPYALSQPETDRGQFAAELPIVGGDQPATHKLEMFLRRRACNAAPQIDDINVFVTRFAAGD